MSFLNINTGIIDSISFSVTPGWNSAGYPQFKIVSSNTFPELSYIRVVMFPTTETVTAEALSPRSTPNTLAELIRSGGFYECNANFTASGTFDKTIELSRNGATDDGENVVYKLAYYFEQKNEDGTSLYSGFVISDDTYTSTVRKPMSGEISVNSYVFSDETDKSKLKVIITYASEINNHLLSLAPSPYLVTIESNDIYYNAAGLMLGSGVISDSTNYFSSAVTGFELNIIISNLINNNVSYKDYIITIYNIDSVGRMHPTGLSFNTAQLRNKYNDIVSGKDHKGIGFLDFSRDESLKQEITPNEIYKKRFSLGINDTYLTNSTFSKKGIYISDYYNVDSPIYSFLLVANEYIPEVYKDIKKSDIIKYYVEFNNNDWINISPLNRPMEINNGVVVPTMCIFDSLDQGSIRSDILELNSSSPVYSFRIKILIDMSFIDGEIYSSPEIFSYECRVTDQLSLVGRR